MRRRRRGIVRSAALRRGAFSLRSGISMGLRSGEYWGRYRSVASRASIASRRAAVRLAKALDPDNCGAGTNRKLLGRLAPRSSTFDLRNHSLPHLPRIGLRHRPASQKRINADRLSHPRPHENPPDSIGAEHALVRTWSAASPADRRSSRPDGASHRLTHEDSAQLTNWRYRHRSGIYPSESEDGSRCQKPVFSPMDDRYAFGEMDEVGKMSLAAFAAES